MPMHSKEEVLKRHEECLKLAREAARAVAALRGVLDEYCEIMRWEETELSMGEYEAVSKLCRTCEEHDGLELLRQAGDMLDEMVLSD